MIYQHLICSGNQKTFTINYTFEEYVKALPEDSVMPKAKLNEIVEDRKEAQKEIANIEKTAAQVEFDNILNDVDEVSDMEQMPTTEMV